MIVKKSGVELCNKSKIGQKMGKWSVFTLGSFFLPCFKRPGKNVIEIEP